MPFVCTLQPLYLIEKSTMSYSYAIFIIFLWIFGYVFSRLANNQKDVFKRDIDSEFYGKKQEYIKTKNGKYILTNLFWGISRHVNNYLIFKNKPNYFGELMNSLCFGLVCGYKYGIIPYLYSIFIWSLLFTRFERDERKCLKKYGEDWKKYMKIVPYKIIPYIW
jgi:delta14-sterol reductase